MDDCTLPSVVLQELGRIQRIEGKGEEVMRHKPWVFLLVYCTPIDNPCTGFSLRLCLPKELELGLKKCCHLVATSSNNFKTNS